MTLTYTLFCIIAVVYLVSFLFSPFPNWATFRFLLRTVLLHKKGKIPFHTKVRQLVFLSKYVLLNPLWTLLWYLDEFLFSAYKQQQVHPVFIIGQPRSGTTFLHRTLAEDSSNFFAIRHFEWRYPYLILQTFLQKTKLAKILLNRSYWPDSNVGQRVAKMHPNKMSDWEEDGIFFEECFLHHFFLFLRFPYPEVLSYVDNFSQLPEKVKQQMLMVHRKIIQKAGYWNNGASKYFLSKEVTSHDKIESILKWYPDAKFIVVVRQSRGYMNSLLELVRYSTLSKTGIDPLTLASWEKVFVERMRQDSLLLTDLCNHKIPKSNQIRISFSVLTVNVLESIEFIYRKIGCCLSDRYIQYLEQKRLSQAKRERGYLYEERDFAGFERYDEFVLKVEKTSEKLRAHEDRKMPPRWVNQNSYKQDDPTRVGL